MNKPKVSIIIPVYNEEKYVKKCLQSLINQSYKNLEIIIVNDGSTDNTQFEVEDIAKNDDKIKPYTTDHVGTAKARNFAVIKSKGSILAFIDADMYVDKNYIKELINPILLGKTKGTFTKEEYVANINNKWAVAWNLEYSKNKSRRIPIEYPNKSNVFRALLKKEFEKVNGYDLISYMQDWTLSKKLGYKASLASGAKMYHYNPETVQEVFSQAKWVATRKYKMGELGRFIALVRANILFSIIFGTIRSIKYSYPFYFVFKLWYDFGLSIGILSYWIDHRHAQ